MPKADFARRNVLIDIEDAHRLQEMWHGTSLSKMVRILIRDALERELAKRPGHDI